GTFIKLGESIEKNIFLHIEVCSFLCNLPLYFRFMKIEYNKRDKTIQIDDSIRQNFQLIYVLLILNLANSSFHLITDWVTEQFSNWSYIWVVLGGISFLLLWFFI